MPRHRPYESAESASPAISRIVAGVLSGKHEKLFRFSALERLGMHILNLLPVATSQSIVRTQFRASSLPSSTAKGSTTTQLCEQRIADYHGLSGQFPVIVIGAALAGAAAHIASILGGPFLPQPFILGLRGGAPQEDLHAHMRTTQPVAEAILSRNPDLCAIGHFDPVHDGWLTRVVSHLRVKLIDLPEPYRQFIRQHLSPGGTILYLNCEAEWLQFPVAPRFVYQIGGWGGIPPEEFIQGSDRIDDFLKRNGSSHRGGWSLPGIEPCWGPESEWGSEDGLRQALVEFAQERGYRIKQVRFAHPHDYSRLAVHAHRQLLERLGEEPQGILIETFTQYDPYLTLAARLLPIWLVFNTVDSLAFMRELLSELPGDLPVYFSGLATLSRTPDMVSWKDWISALGDRPWVSVGAGPRRYPEDLVALFRWVETLQGHLPATPPAKLPHLPIDDFLGLLPS